MFWAMILCLFGFQSDYPVGGAVADDYYVVIFSYQKRTGKLEPAETHTFASWVRMRDKGVLEQVDINWGPKEGDIRLITKPVPGKNFGLKETIEHAVKEDKKLSYWVLRTDMTFFEMAKKQRDSLTMYKLFDRKTRPKAVNCIHAVSDTAGFLDTKLSCGIEAGQKVADFFVKEQKAWATQDTDVAKIILRNAGCIVK